MNGCGADVHAIYRQRPEVLLPPVKPHECSPIASTFTVRPNFDLTAKRRRKFGINILTVSLAVKSFRLPAIAADSPRKLDSHSRQKTDCQSSTCEALKAIPRAIFDSPR